MLRLPAAIVVAALLVAAPASAHKANPNFLTRVDAVTPQTRGITVDVLNRDDQLLLTNRSDSDVLIAGYDDEPYARIDTDGTVSVNTRSPAYHLNEERFGDAPVPDGVDGKDRPRWKVLDRTGRFEWHDHRMHWMARSRPPQVEDPDKRTTVFRWTVPLTVGGTRGDIAGTLFWTPRPGAPVGLIVALGAFTVLSCVGAVVVRRRREKKGTVPVLSHEDEAW